MTTTLQVKTTTKKRVTKQKVISFSGTHAKTLYAICDLAEQHLTELSHTHQRDERDDRWYKIPDRDALLDFITMVNASRGKKRPKMQLHL